MHTLFKQLRTVARIIVFGFLLSGCDSGKTVVIGGVPPGKPPSRTPVEITNYSLFSANAVRDQAERVFAQGTPFQKQGADIQSLDFSDDKPRLVVIYLIDALRADGLGAYGNARETSPHIDAFAKNAVVFERCFSYATWTLPSVRSILASMHVPTEVKASQRGGMPEGATLLQTVFQREGWLTAFISESPFVAMQNGLAAGFTLHTPVYKQFRSLPGQRRTPQGNAFAMKTEMSTYTSLAESIFLERHAAGPAFLYIHTLEVHEPFAAPRPFDALKPINGSMENMKAVKYEMATRFADHNFGLFIAMLNERGLFDDTLLVFCADHGEMLVNGECEDTMGHGGYLCLAKNHVPLMFSWPRKIAGGRVAENVRTLDIAPTILDLMGMPLPQSYTGNSLRPFLLGGDTKALEGRTLILSGSNGGEAENDVVPASADDIARAGSNIGLVHDDAFFIRFNTHDSLYRPSLGASPQKNVAANDANEAARLSAMLDQALAEHPLVDTSEETADAPPTSPADDEAHREALKALGYL